MHGRAGATADAGGRRAGLRRRRPGRHDGRLRPRPDPPRPGGAGLPRGRAARVHVVATHPDHRRRGYARAVVSTLLDHLADVEDITLFELHTSTEAALLYRELGFSGSPALMRMTRRSQPVVGAAGAQPDSTWVPPQQYADSLPRAAAFVCLYATDEDDRPLQPALRLLPRPPLAHDRRRDGSGRAALGRGGA